MKEGIFIVLNLIAVPLLLIIGNFSPLSISIFWIVSFLIAIFFLKPSLTHSGVCFLLSPFMLTYLYSVINYITGSLYYCSDVLSGTRFYTEFFHIEHFRLFLILLYLNMCNTIVVIIASRFRTKLGELKSLRPVSKSSFISIVVLFAIFFFITYCDN